MSTDAKTAVSQAQPTVGRFTEIPYDQFTPEQQEAYGTLIDAEGLYGYSTVIVTSYDASYF
jgi:hypothetical protein